MKNVKNIVAIVAIALLNLNVLQAQITASGSITGSYSDLGTAINACTTGTCTLTVSNNNATIGVAATVKSGVTVIVKSSSTNTKRTITRNNNSGYITVTGTLNMTDIILDGAKASYTSTKSMITMN
ncbi:MAG: hypothetical protein J5606_10620, partial [Bacteroidales bacterium]|nr:hypothetical protein [Bacteroidales bacterium]